MTAIYTYQQIRDRLLKYKKEYENDLESLSEEFETNKAYIRGNIHMINFLLDDLDSESGIAWLGADFAESEPKPHKRKICEGNCEECIFATVAKEYYLKICDSAFDAASDYNDFIKRCKKENSIEL